MVDRLPPGFVIDEKPAGLPPGFVIDEPKTETPQVSASDAFVRATLDRIANNLLSFPALTERIGREGLQALGLDVSDETFLPRGDVAPVRAVGQMSEEAVSRFLGGDFQGALGALQFDPALEQVRAEEERIRQGAPTASMFGEVIGDISTLALAGRPLGRAARRGAGQALSKSNISNVLQNAKQFEAGRLADRVIKTQFAKKVGGGLGKAAETGLEGATLALFDEGDPIPLGLYSGGFQAAGSLSREALKKTFQKGIGSGILKTAGVIALLQVFVPGGRNFILEAVEDARDKMALALTSGFLLGGMTGRAGKVGSLFPRGAKAAPRISKFFNDASREARAFMRGGAIATARELFDNREAGNLGPENALKAILADPSGFSERTIKLIEQAMTDSDKSLTAAYNRLIKEDTVFRRKIQDLNREPPPLNEQAAETGPTPTGRIPQFPTLAP